MFSTHSDVCFVPAAPVHALKPLHPSQPFEQEAESRSELQELPRSASYTDIARDGSTGSSSGIKRTFSENVLALTPDSAVKTNGSAYVANKELFRRASRKAKNKIIGAKFSLPSDDDPSIQSSEGSRSSVEQAERMKGPSRSVTGTIRSLARKSFMPAVSRSPSPSPQTKDHPKTEIKRSRSPFKKSAKAVSEIITVPAPVHSRAASTSSQGIVDEKKTPDIVVTSKDNTVEPRPIARPMSVMDFRNKSETDLRLSRPPSTLSLRSKSSVDHLHSRLSSIRMPPVPSSISSDRLSTASFDESKRKDPLLGPFRALEGEFLNFQSKTSAHKAKVIRSSLLPFLSKYTNHLSNKILRAEDLDRRIMILNKWWTGLLEMLNGPNHQSISGTDRPTFLEAVTGIMMRPEWRIPPFLTTTPSGTPHFPKSRSTNSLASCDSEFLIESIHHNVRNTFVQNLLSQMVYVVERMSMRNAPASLVAFCGKSCAYAFFYCPGIADILVRLWRVPIGTLQRVFKEFGVDRGFKFDPISKDIISRFPPPLRSLRVESQAGLARRLQHRTPSPTGTAYVRWYGPWLGRWSGRDSDLFFVFVKHFHLLVSEHLTNDTDAPSTACVPGLVPVLSQVLAVLESTLYRHSGQAHADNLSSGSVDDMDNLESVATMPMTIANVSRSIAENRLIMVLRDILSDSNVDRQHFREFYVKSFNSILKAASLKISIYNNEACFVLCDLLEEVLPIMSRYESSHPNTSIIEWPFWLQVCRQMMQSHNTLTEVRLIAFVYSTWNILISNEETKRELYLEWILEPEFFKAHFNHWCPMVRHYFLRLLCWRVARYDGNASDLDTQIYEAFAARLNTCWSHYSYLTAEADMRNTAPPSSAPCTPAPNRRLVIMRTDSHPAPGSSLFSFDKLIISPNSSQNTPYGRSSSLLNSPPTADSPTQNKKRWSLFKNFMPFGAPGNSRPGEVTPPKRGTDSSDVSDTASISSVSIRSGMAPEKSRPSTPPHQPFSFKFSLEWLDRPQWPTKNQTLTAPNLPAATQILVQMRRERTEAVQPLKPSSEDLNTAKYSGRALAEWALIVTEFDNFHSRRREEGVPTGRLVETPTLSVESFRMFG